MIVSHRRSERDAAHILALANIAGFDALIGCWGAKFTYWYKRFFDSAEPVFALAAETNGKLVGLAHYLFHRSTTRMELTCYLEDLFTLPLERGRGIGRALIEGVYEQARCADLTSVYWQTHASNEAGRLLYDKVATHSGFIVYSKDL